MAFPRAALVGNPSDGYNGKTIAFVFDNYCAEVELYETPELEILPSFRDRTRFDSLESMHRDVELYGYYGGIRLLKAAGKKFYEYCSIFEVDYKIFSIFLQEFYKLRYPFYFLKDLLLNFVLQG